MKSILLLATLTAAALAQGPLTPPGPPGPAMKSLDELDQKLTQIDTKLGQVFRITSLPFTISLSGSYVVDADLAGAPGGITIAASDVTLDFQGHILHGGGAAQIAIAASGTPRNLVIRNGTITSWASGGVELGACENVRLENLRVVASARSGVGARASVLRCFFQVEAFGFVAGNNASVRESIVEGGPLFLGGASFVADSRAVGGSITTGNGAVVDRCIVHGAPGVGITVGFDGRISGSSALNCPGGGFLAGDHTQIVDCVASRGAAGLGTGFEAANPIGFGLLVERCTAFNYAIGFRGGRGATIRTATAVACPTGIRIGDDGLVADSTVTAAAEAGIEAGSNVAIRRCTVGPGPTAALVRLIAGTVSDCQLQPHTGVPGIAITGFGARVEGNHVLGTIHLTSTSSRVKVVRNTVASVLNEGANNQVAPIEPLGSSTNPWANSGF